MDSRSRESAETSGGGGGGGAGLPLAVRELVAGGVAGGVAKSAVAPLERVKILFQANKKSRVSWYWVEGILPHNISHRRGNGANVARIVPYAALHYMAYEEYRRWIILGFPNVEQGPILDLMAGSIAGGTAVICTYPLDLVRTKLSYQVKGAAANVSFRESKPSEQMKTHVPEEHRKDIIAKLGCGSVAGLLGQTITYPLDVVRRQMQVEALSSSSLAKGKGTFGSLVMIAKQQGWRQLFAGLSINYLKVVPSVAIGFTVYDYMKVWLKVPSREEAVTVLTEERSNTAPIHSS
ncbi:hypothetical protein PR202_gb06652 [Eleusine coracana subsp. coracana]|uniref:Mitochondrial carrier protein n=1 Tax=Eleusine coracana subsp. coracana TaxID=191504 RepID=A0AAV5E7N4_ELECO|nr:hypothetical protein PR202_gb06652 [Eleusine coracana subsp. coracana]